MKNVGDHAQVIAIQIWLKKHFPKLPLIEMDKNQVRYFLPALKWLVQPDDVLFLHSGGNLGDRGMWSERVRRLVILAFPKNQIISLPQTIYFSDTPTGRREQENTRTIYATHPNLTIIGRDQRSGELAAELFPKAQTFCMPDFVLSLSPSQSDKRNNPPKVLLCMRLDDESALTAEQRREIAICLPYQCTYYDTTLAEPIKVSERKVVLEDALSLFRAFDVVVTDRYHGLIFAVLCRKPCVVLRTVDHKLTSAMYWFKNVPFVTFAQELADIPSVVESCLAIKTQEVPNWNAEYFDKIPNLTGLG
ncbi:polysaccharide pyruvyl transferase family protein [Chroococcidiopsis cubana]|uniref:polysaccharide pyruvyl transferase family protein n=1 Tax=Chroococcidiopsis cubana TaxID=171392 RepID=UPI00131536D4|nr:polysaccharide pyruvyl transferase family protein [Chroococcidiopsis cubana]